MALISQPLPPKSLGAPVPTGDGVPIRVAQVLMGLVGVTAACTFQFVAHRASSKGEPVGNPVFHRKMPESCHPPTSACSARLSVLNKDRPLPNGICHTVETLMRCRISKSELP